jgi:HAD superfamily hydrolase (TIGR01509 family)
VTGRTQAVLFDMDGLLIDSEPIWSVAEAEIMDWLGGPWNLDVKAACLGKRVDESCRNLVAIAGSEHSPIEVMDRLLQRMCQLYRQHLPWHEGAVELLDALGQRGIPRALVSSSYRVLVDVALEEMGPRRFELTLAGDEVTFAKPHPEPYLRAAAALGVAPERCVVFEDSLTGVTAAEAAGCVCVAVPDVVPVDPTPTRPVIGSLAEVTVEWLTGLT